jgi:uncharacterized BrkB/YihY/UPF0761 family membrane protein
MVFIVLVLVLAGWSQVLHRLGIENQAIYRTMKWLTPAFQFFTIVLLMRTMFPGKPSWRPLLAGTVLFYFLERLLVKALGAYATLTLGSRSVYGSWALVPVFLFWLYANFYIYFLILTLIRVMTDRRVFRWATLKQAWEWMNGRRTGKTGDAVRDGAEFKQ